MTQMGSRWVRTEANERWCVAASERVIFTVPAAFRVGTLRDGFENVFIGGGVTDTSASTLRI